MEYTGQEGTHNGHPSCCDCPAALKLKVKSLNHVWLFATPWTVACHIPLSVGFSRQEYWSGLPFPSPRDLPNPGIEPRSPSTPGRLSTVWATREAHCLKAEAVMKKNTERRKIFVVLLWCSVQFSRSVVSDSLQPHKSQHTRPPCPSPTPRVYSDWRPSSQWCHPAISSSVVPFSSCSQSLPSSGSFPMSQLFTWGGQSIGVSALASILPKNTQDWSPLGWTGWISLQSKGLSRVFSNTTVQKHQFFGAQLSSQSNFHIHTWLLE